MATGMGKLRQRRLRGTEQLRVRARGSSCVC